MRFQVHPPDLVECWPEVYRAYISGYDGRVFPTRVEVDGALISCRRHVPDSGRVHVAWPVAGFGMPMISTSSLCEREDPYLLPVELARGKLAQLRDQISAWEISGMQVPPRLLPVYRDAHRAFAAAATGQSNPEDACRLADQALAATFAAGDLLAREYIRLRMAIRKQKTATFPAALGCHLGEASADILEENGFAGIFSAAMVPVEWRKVESAEGVYHWELFDEQVKWCLERKLTLFGGPLLDLSSEGLPEWLWQWEHDYFNLQSFVIDYLETAVARYQGSIRLWEVVARPNTGGVMTLNEQNRLALTAKALEIVHHVDNDLQLILRVEQPWGEYQARGHHRLSPLQFVDTLVRSGCSLAAVNVEIAIGYRPQGSASRDLIEVSQLLDLWSSLGLPLFVTLAYPAADVVDERAKQDIDLDSPQWKQGFTPEAQADWIDEILPMVLAKQQVIGVFWSHFADSRRHDFPHAGLLDQQNQPRPALQKFVNARRIYWGELPEE